MHRDGVRIQLFENLLLWVHNFTITIITFRLDLRLSTCAISAKVTVSHAGGRHRSQLCAHLS